MKVMAKNGDLTDLNSEKCFWSIQVFENVFAKTDYHATELIN